MVKEKIKLDERPMRILYLDPKREMKTERTIGFDAYRLLFDLRLEHLGPLTPIMPYARVAKVAHRLGMGPRALGHAFQDLLNSGLIKASPDGRGIRIQGMTIIARREESAAKKGEEM